jgi:hypothetical protein
MRTLIDDLMPHITTGIRITAERDKLERPLQRLCDTFKSCQFVVTTHSPLVLGEVPARCVRFLEFVDGKVNVFTPSEAYGMDANRILQEFMGASVRNQQVEADLKALFELIDQERFDDARTAISMLVTGSEFATPFFIACCMRIA